MTMVLGIETSCDDTGVALVHCPVLSKFGQTEAAFPRLVAHALHSQADMHQTYGGVVPELASRDHIAHLLPLVEQVLAEAKCTPADLGVLAYTQGPGLAGALLVGASFACGLAFALDKPSLGVHHLEGHLLSPFLSDDPPQFPFLALLVSGGHTQLMAVEALGRYRLLGQTVDDAAGEAFDKSAKLLGLGYPGGPALAALAQQGNPRAYALPRPLQHSLGLDFSFAGLKTAVLLQTQKGALASAQSRADLAASTQAAIVDVLSHKTLAALKQTGLRRLVVAGGVGANALLRSTLSQACAQEGVQVHYPPLAWCSDNGAMIALAGALHWQAGNANVNVGYPLVDVHPRWPLV